MNAKDVPVASSWAVVLIHGVGDTEPGKMIDAVSGPLAKANWPMTFLQGHRIARFPENPGLGKARTNFPAHMLWSLPGPVRVCLAEVHWADLTRVEATVPFLARLPAFASTLLSWLAGQLLLAAALVHCVYGIRHVALQAALLPGKLGQLFHAALRTAVFLLQGPVYALYVFELLLCVVYLVFIPGQWDDATRPRGSILATLAVVAVILTVLSGTRWVVLRRWHQRPVFWPSLFIVTIVVLVHLLLRSVGIADAWYEALIPRLNVLEGQRPGELPLVVFIIDYVLDRVFAVIAICVMAAGIILAVATATHASRDVLKSMWAAFLIAVLIITLWEIVAEPVDLIAQWSYDRSRRDCAPLYTVWFNEASLAGFAVALVTTASLVIVRQIRWAQRGAAKQAPRLIVGVPIQICLVVFACVLFPMVLIDGLDIHELRVYKIDYVWIYLIYSLALAVVFSGAVVFRNVVHILRDIIIHFQSPSANGLFLGPLYSARRYPVRRRIAKRLRAVLELVLEKRPTHLLVIAHSQGTMIALEELRKHRWTGRLAGLESVTLLTFGSPLKNLYQNYLSLQYGDLTQGRWQTLPKNVRTWVNVYRPDDYVGTQIESPVPNWPRNVPLKPGLRLRGHTRYWELEVFLKIRDLLPSTIPDWLWHRGGSMKLASDEKTWIVLIGGGACYSLVPTPVKGRLGCKIVQTVNGCHVPSAATYATADEALAGGLEDLRMALGW